MVFCYCQAMPPGGRGRKVIDFRTRELIQVTLKETHGNAAETARRLNIGYSTVMKWKTLDKNGLSGATVARSVAGDIPGPLREEGLHPDVRKLLDDFPAFRKKYFKRDTPAFQTYAAELLSDENTPARVILWPPGHGKTTLVGHDWIIWTIIRKRARGEWFSCLYVSKTYDMSQKYVGRVKRTLDFHEGLKRDFGYFKPQDADIWKRGEILVAGFDTDHDEKEATLMSSGAGTHIYSLRVSLIIVDDLVDKELSRSAQVTRELHEWFAEELESRLNAGGRMVYVGTRWSSLDLPGKLIKMQDYEGNRFYDLIEFKAHDTTKCFEPDLCKCKGPCDHHQAWPEGCTLWPAVWYYKPKHPRDMQALQVIRQKVGSDRFDFQYNQVEVPSADARFRYEWIEMCKDRHRGWWQIPDFSQVYCSIDPSGSSGYACFQCWAYQPHSETHFLVAQHRDHMTMPHYFKLIEDWTLRLRALGIEPTWILEENMARFLIQSFDFKQLKWSLGGLKLITHYTTGRNKWDSDMGVESMAPDYEFKRINLPYGDPQSVKSTDILAEELVAYPYGETDDCVMTQWFYMAHVKKLSKQPAQQWIDNPNIPPYLLQRRRLIDPWDKTPALGDIRIKHPEVITHGSVLP